MVISPGIPHNYPMPHPAAAHAHRQQIPIISEVELALRAKPKARLVVITGTNGKSTTTAVVVDFPLVPVITTSRALGFARNASSTSLIIGICWR